MNDNSAMNLSSFLEVIDSTTELHHNHPDHDATQERLLANALRKLPDEELHYFDAWSSFATNLLNGSSLNSAASKFYGDGEFSDDFWWYHCNWVVSLGSIKFKLAIHDPDSFYASFATERDFPISANYDAGSFGYGPYLNEIERRGIGEPLAVDPVDELSSELTRISKLERSEFPKITNQLSKHKCDYFDSYDGPLRSAAIRIWDQSKNKPSG